MGKPTIRFEGYTDDWAVEIIILHSSVPEHMIP